MKLRLHEEIPVFIDTNLGTHLALPIPPGITAGHLKRKLGQEHLSCFPNLGEIKVHALMVKRRSHFYHLPDVISIKSAFQGFTGTWFLQMHASTLQDMPLLKNMPSTVKLTGIDFLSQGKPLEPTASQKLSFQCTEHCKDQMRQLQENQPSRDITESSQFEIVVALGDNNRSSIGNEEQVEALPVPTSTKKVRRGKIAEDTRKKAAHVNETHILESFSGLSPTRMKQFRGNTTMNNQTVKHLISCHSLESKEAPCMTASKEISVTGIISKYFSDVDEVNSCGNRCEHRLEDTHNSEIVCSTRRASEYSVDQKRTKEMAESDTDTVCSINNDTVSDAKLVKASLADRKVSVTDVSNVRRAAKKSYKKTKRATGSEIRNKASRSRRMIPTAYSDKLQVGKKLIQAANNITISGRRRKLSKIMLVSRSANLSAPESSVLVRNLAFELDDLDD